MGGPAGPGGRRGVEALTPVLSLDDAAEHPDRLVGLPERRLQELLRASRLLVVHVEHALGLARLDGGLVEAPRPSTKSEEDQYLDPEAAARLLGVNTRFLRGRTLPGRVVLGPRRIVYSRNALLKFARTRQEPR
jgi:hypothetical protein